jgi:propionyl-CoA synthetase
MGYAETYQHSLTDPQGFWREQAQDIPWYTAPTTILDQDANGAWRWFRGGKLNCFFVAL